MRRSSSPGCSGAWAHTCFRLSIVSNPAVVHCHGEDCPGSSSHFGLQLLQWCDASTDAILVLAPDQAPCMLTMFVLGDRASCLLRPKFQTFQIVHRHRLIQHSLYGLSPCKASFRPWSLLGHRLHGLVAVAESCFVFW